MRKIGGKCDLLNEKKKMRRQNHYFHEKTSLFQITLFPNPSVHAFFASQLTVADAF